MAATSMENFVGSTIPYRVTLTHSEKNLKFKFINAFCSCRFSLSVCAVLESCTCDWDLVSFSVYLRACVASRESRSQILSFPLQTMSRSTLTG